MVGLRISDEDGGIRRQWAKAGGFIALIAIGSFLLIFEAWGLALMGYMVKMDILILFGGMIATVIGSVGLFWLTVSCVQKGSQIALAGLAMICLGAAIGAVSYYSDGIPTSDISVEVPFIMSGWGMVILAGIALIVKSVIPSRIVEIQSGTTEE